MVNLKWLPIFYMKDIKATISHTVLTHGSHNSHHFSQHLQICLFFYLFFFYILQYTGKGASIMLVVIGKQANVGYAKKNPVIW